MCFWSGFGATCVSTLAVYELLWENQVRREVSEARQQSEFHPFLAVAAVFQELLIVHIPTLCTD